MKYKILIGAAILMLITTVSCDSWLDVNEDPNNLAELTSPEVVLPTAQVGIANTIMGWDMGFAGGFWSEYWTQNYTASQFKFLEEYQETSFSNAYQSLYAYPLNDLYAVLKASEETSGEYLVAELLSIYTWQLVTDIWGAMPYFEALKGDEGIVHPHYDQGEDIYADLLDRINKVLETDYSSATLNSTYDFIYEGSIDDWLKFGNALKLKLMLRLSETPDYNNASVLSFVESADFLTTTAMIPGSYWNGTTDGKMHPMVEFEENGANYFSTNVIASRTLLDYLKLNADPRLDVLYDAPSSGVQLGAFQGDFDSKEDSDGNGVTDDNEEYSTVSFAADADIPLLSVWEVEFNIAEIYTRAGDNASAKEHYDAGVQASLDYWGLAGSITGAGEYAEWQNGTIEEGLKQIAMQKWVAHCKLENIEAWLERNRTKYPSVNEIDIARDRQDAHLNFPVGDFTISVKGRGKLNGNLPSSPTYPNTLINRNNNSPSQKADIGEKVWWNQKSGK